MINRTQKRIASISKILRSKVNSYAQPVVEQVANSRDPYRVLVSTMLSLRTKDAVTASASKRLFRKAPTVSRLMALTRTQIESCIYPVGFYKTKAKHLRETARIIVDHHEGKVPGTEAKLLALPGVGRKTANLVLSLAFDQAAICVDTHVHRISNRLDLVRTATPHETEIALQAILHKRYWSAWNMWLVVWGQNVCSPIRPKCSACALKPFCPQRGVTTSR